MSAIPPKSVSRPKSQILLGRAQLGPLDVELDSVATQLNFDEIAEVYRLKECLQVVEAVRPAAKDA